MFCTVPKKSGSFCANNATSSAIILNRDSVCHESGDQPKGVYVFVDLLRNYLCFHLLSNII